MKKILGIKFAGSLAERLMSPGYMTTLATNENRFKCSETVLVSTCRWKPCGLQIFQEWLVYKSSIAISVFAWNPSWFHTPLWDFSVPRVDTEWLLRGSWCSYLWGGGETHGIVGSPSMLHWGYLVTSHLIIHPKSVQLRARHPAGLEIMLAPTGLHHHRGHNVNQAMSVLWFQILLLIKHSGI